MTNPSPDQRPSEYSTELQNSFQQRDQQLRECLDLHAREQFLKKETAQCRERADHASNPTLRASHERDATLHDLKRQDITSAREAAESRYLDKDRSLTRRIEAQQHPNVRHELWKESLARKTDIQMTAAAKTKTEFTRDNATRAVSWMEHGCPEAARPSEVQNFLRGSDLSQKVEVVPIEQGQQLTQRSYSQETAGSFFANPGTEASRVGVDDEHRHYRRFEATDRLTALRSKASPVDDYFSHDRTVTPTRGGSDQYWIDASQRHLLEHQHQEPRHSESATASKNHERKSHSLKL